MSVSAALTESSCRNVFVDTDYPHARRSEWRATPHHSLYPEKLSELAVDVTHMLGVVSISVDPNGGRQGVEVGKLVGGQAHGHRGSIFADTLNAACARNRYNPRLLGKKPR